MEVSVRLYAPLRRVIDTHSFLVGSYQGGESDIIGVVMAYRGETTLRDLRKPVEETRMGKTNRRSRLFQDMVYYFNDAPNIHGMPESRRRRYLFGLLPKDKDPRDDSKTQEVHPTVVPYEKETEMIADQVLPRILERPTVVVIQEFIVGPGCGQVCLGDRPCTECDMYKASLVAAAEGSLDGDAWEPEAAGAAYHGDLGDSGYAGDRGSFAGGSSLSGGDFDGSLIETATAGSGGGGAGAGAGGGGGGGGGDSSSGFVKTVP